MEVHNACGRWNGRARSTHADATYPRALKVQLTPFEVAMAAQVGCRRQIESLIKGLKPAYGASPEGAWSIHIEGACGEIAVAKAMGVYWDGSVNTFGKPDIVGSSLQIRTRSKENYDLIVRTKDKDDEVMVLVTGIAPIFEIRGWMVARDAKQHRFLQTYGGRDAAYFVPSKELKPIEELAGFLR